MVCSTCTCTCMHTCRGTCMYMYVVCVCVHPFGTEACTCVDDVGAVQATLLYGMMHVHHPHWNL